MEKEYKIVVLSCGVQVLAERHLYCELVDAKRQATRDLHKYKGLQVYVYQMDGDETYPYETLVAKRCQDFPRHPGFWVSML